ncbi:MAG: biopolymer transporter ExbD [Deltaproteobacteria bacterium]|nr:biopolymer transporter ExbD [Deltaproteobacteria bacterium]
MARKPSRRRRPNPHGEELDLTAVMNLFMVLIPFLLLSAVFAKTVSIDIVLPTGSAAQAAAPSEPLTVTMKKSGILVGGIGRAIPFLERKSGKYDFETLNKRLFELKRQHPAKEDIVLLFPKDAAYNDVIRLMDSTREIIVKEGGVSSRKPLFPVVSVGEHGE